MRLDGEKEAHPFEESFDYVVVGSGAAGATAARVLSDKTSSVAVVEEGPAVDTPRFGDRTFPALSRLFRDMGGQVTRGKSYIPVVQGRCLGGSTVVNSAITYRLPDDVWEPWEARFGLGEALPLKKLHANWDRIEKDQGVHPTPPIVWGEFNRLMDESRKKLGVSAAPTNRYTRGCKGSARCLTGCPHGAKQSMLLTYLPYAEKKGAALITGAKVDRVIMSGNRAVGVRGNFRSATGKKGPRFKIVARKGVLLAASAIQTPGVLSRSGVRSQHLGKNFQGHPGSPLIGLFDKKVDMWLGATQGYDTDHHRTDGRYKIETISLPPEIVFTRMPGVGKEWLSSIAESPHAVIWAVQMRAYARGSVTDRFFGTDIQYDLEPRDMASLKRGLRFTAELLFAAGAREIITGIHGMPGRLKHPGEVALFDHAPDHPSAYSMIVSHLFGTARMSLEPSAGVVGHDFAVHGTENLYVMDSSLFPTNIGVNPQHTIMAVSMLGAERIAERS